MRISSSCLTAPAAGEKLTGSIKYMILTLLEWVLIEKDHLVQFIYSPGASNGSTPDSESCFPEFNNCNLLSFDSMST